MTRRHLAALAALTTLALGVAACGSDDEATGTTETTTATETGTTGSAATLDGTVGPGFTISLTQGGQDVSTLTAGTYTLDVDDMSDQHNFHLTGPGGVDVSTQVGETETESFEVTLEAGTYTFVCDPHAGSMNGSFEVTG